MDQALRVSHLSSRIWRRVVIVAAVVSALVGGAVSLADRAADAQPERGGPRVEAPLNAPGVDGSCREAIVIPKRGWVCRGR